MANGFLYDDGRIRINYLETSPEDHNLVIGSQRFILQRGVLEELSKTSPSDLKPKLSAIDDMIDYAVVNSNLTYEGLGLALAQARVRELERHLQEAMRDLAEDCDH